jgi:hypothetical protein
MGPQPLQLLEHMLEPVVAEFIRLALLYYVRETDHEQVRAEPFSFAACAAVSPSCWRSG